MESMPATADGRGPSLAEDPALGLTHRQKLEILGAVLLALFLGALDQTIVSTAMPQILTDLNGSALYTWVITIYLLTSTITVPFYGKLSDLFGRRPLLLFGIGVFLIGSALSGLSQTMEQLIIFRGLQGIGAGALFPISLAVIGDLFSPAERGRYQGLFGAVFGLSFILGPAIGGLLTDFASWHWVFFVNIPIGIVSMIVIWRLLPTVRRPDASRDIDFLGGGVFAVAISFLLVGLTNKSGLTSAGIPNEWTDFPVGGFILIALVLSAIFLVIESRAKEPIVPLNLWRDRTYASSIISTFLISFGFFGAIIFLPRWFQVVRGESATLSGYLLFPLLIGLIGSSIISGIIVSRTGRYKVLVLSGIAIMAVGLLLMRQLTATTEYPAMFLWMFVTGVGIGPTLSVFTIIVQNAVPFSVLGVATSNLTFFRQIGGTVGLAIAGTVFGNSLLNRLPTEIVGSLPGELQPQAQQMLGSGSGFNVNPNDLTGVGQSFGAAVAAQVPALQPLIPNLDAAFHQAMSLSIADTFAIGIVTAVFAFAAALFMREIPLRRSNTESVPSPAAEGATAGEGGPQPRFRESPVTE
jgi:EmrB/QacA subfamily drug resistance transporter